MRGGGQHIYWLTLYVPAQVGMAGFEPTTSRPLNECATGLRHIPNRVKNNKIVAKLGSVVNEFISPTQRKAALSPCTPWGVLQLPPYFALSAATTEKQKARPRPTA